MGKKHETLAARFTALGKEIEILVSDIFEKLKEQGKVGTELYASIPSDPEFGQLMSTNLHETQLLEHLKDEVSRIGGVAFGYLIGNPKPYSEISEEAAAFALKIVAKTKEKETA